MSGVGHGGQPIVEVVPGSDGLRSHLAGLRVAPQSQTLDSSAATPWRFQIIGCDGSPLRHFDRENTKLLHLIVVRSDLTGYQHLHPMLEPDGTFTIDLRVARPGTYRAITDFVIDGRKYVLATTLNAQGRASLTPLPAPALESSSDGYDVELQRPARLTAGQAAQLTFRISRHGQPVDELQPYLGSYGHLVALHSADVAYSHVHPVSADPSSGAITFDAELEQRGAYRLFLQFQTQGHVHTVAFTQTAS